VERRRACAGPPKDVIMERKTTTALALTGALAAAPAAVAATKAEDPPSPEQRALRVPLAGHLTVAAQMRAERVENVREDLTPRAVRLAGRLADVRGEGFSATEERRRLRGASPTDLRGRMRDLRHDVRDARHAAAAAAAPAATASPALEAIAACESGGDPTTDTGNGFYGKYQFDLGTWQSVGGTGNPAAASEAEQDARAAMLYARAGASPWPVCGR
jgi:hypothetical protein